MKAKRFVKIMVLIQLAAALFFLVSEKTNAEIGGMPEINGEHAITMEPITGEILYEKNAYSKAFPASVTKVMTALLVAEKIKPGEIITLSEACVKKERSNSQILFKAGEQMDRDTALFTMMVISANDVACALGEHISGSEEAFGQLMTERARELGAKNTNFVNPHGLHDENHYTTAYDMALITREAIKHDIVLKAMGTKEYVVNTNFQTNVKITNPSRIFDDPDSIGGKTGYTNQARNTLIKIDEKNGFRLINVILGNNSKVNKYNIYTDIKNISDYGFGQLENDLAIDKTKWEKEVNILGESVSVVPEENIVLPKKRGTIRNYKIEFSPKEREDEEYYEKGIQKGEKLGVLNVYVNGTLVAETNAVAKETIHFERPTKKAGFPGFVKVSIAIVLPILIYLMFMFMLNYRYYKRKRNQQG